MRAGPLVPETELARCLASLHAELDHKNLNHQVPGLTKRPKTTESLAQYLHERVAAVLPIHRVRLHERDDFFAEYWDDGGFFLGMQRPFSAAHRLHAASLSEAENLSLYGKCNNPRGHGHRYLTEATIGGPYDERSGTLYSFAALLHGIEGALRPWQDKHLDLETEEFRATPSTGENIVRVLWPKFSARLDDRLTRLRLWETPNNRFTLRSPMTAAQFRRLALSLPEAVESSTFLIRIFASGTEFSPRSAIPIPAAGWSGSLPSSRKNLSAPRRNHFVRPPAPGAGAGARSYFSPPSMWRPFVPSSRPPGKTSPPKSR